MPLSEDTIRLILDLGNSGKNVKDVVEELEKLDATTKNAGKSTADFGRSALETGRIIQDFAQGGLGGIINNLEGFTRAIGLGPGAAGVMTILGVAALTAAPHIKALWKELVDGANKVPESTDKLARLNEELATSKKRMDELKDQQSLTNKELAEYNRLSGETVRLEKAVNEERQKRNAIDAARREEQAGNPETSAIVKAAAAQGGGVDATIRTASQNLYQLSRDTGPIGDIVKQMDEIATDLVRRKAAGQSTVQLSTGSGISTSVDIDKYYQGLLEPLQKSLNDAIRQVGSEAKDIVGKSLLGDVGATRRLAGLVPGGAFDQALPENIRAQDAEVEAVDEQGQRLRRGNARRRRNAAQVAGLNRAGQENEAALGRDQQAAREKDNALAETLTTAGNKNEAFWRNQMDSEASSEFQKEHEKNVAIANQRVQGPTFRQAAEALQMRQRGFQEASEKEQARGVENGPATQALRATTAKLNDLMQQYAEAVQATQQEVADLQGVVGAGAQYIQKLKANNRNLQKNNSILNRGQ